MPTAVRAIHEGAEVVRPAVEPGRREEVDAVVAPAEVAGEVRDRHHLHDRDASPRQLRQLLAGGVPGAGRREGADVHLVDDLALARDARPLGVRPGEVGRVDRPRTARAGPRAGIERRDRGRPGRRRGGTRTARPLRSTAPRPEWYPRGSVSSGTRSFADLDLDSARPGAPTRGSARPLRGRARPRPAGAATPGGELLALRTDGRGRNFHTRPRRDPGPRRNRALAACYRKYPACVEMDTCDATVSSPRQCDVRSTAARLEDSGTSRDPHGAFDPRSREFCGIPIAPLFLAHTAEGRRRHDERQQADQRDGRHRHDAAACDRSLPAR